LTNASISIADELKGENSEEHLFFGYPHVTAPRNLHLTFLDLLGVVQVCKLQTKKDESIVKVQRGAAVTSPLFDMIGCIGLAHDDYRWLFHTAGQVGSSRYCKAGKRKGINVVGALDVGPCEKCHHRPARSML
jgi:hypothetical protein